MRFEVLTVITFKIAVLWYITPCSSIDRHQCFRVYCLHIQGLQKTAVIFSIIILTCSQDCVIREEESVDRFFRHLDFVFYITSNVNMVVNDAVQSIWGACHTLNLNSNLLEHWGKLRTFLVILASPWTEIRTRDFWIKNWNVNRPSGTQSEREEFNWAAFFLSSTRLRPSDLFRLKLNYETVNAVNIL
jgi:hypothetical protein